MNIKMIGAAVLAGAMVVGCGTAKEDDEVVASVDGAKLMQSQVADDIDAVIKAQGANIPTNQLDYVRQMLRGRIVQAFISKAVLLAKADKEGITVSDDDLKAKAEEIIKMTAGQPDAPKSLEDIYKKSPMGEERTKKEFNEEVRIGKLIKVMQAKQPVKDYAAEVNKIIDGIVSNNSHAADSAAAALKKINGLKAQLDKVPAAELRARFAELAKANSECPSGKEGGDLKEFTRGNMVKEFDEAAFTLPVDKLSDPIKTQFGYHLILVTEKHPAVEAQGDKPAQPEKVRASHILVKCEAVQDVPKKEDLEKMLKGRDEREYVQKLIMELLQSANIETVEEFKHLLPEKKAAAPVEPAEEKKSDAQVEKPAAK